MYLYRVGREILHSLAYSVLDSWPDLNRGNLSVTCFGIALAVSFGRPRRMPFALARRRPLLIRSMVILRSSSAKTPMICNMASVIGSMVPVQSIIRVPITSLSFRALARSIISHSCRRDLVSRETSSVIRVSPSVIWERSLSSSGRFIFVPDSYSK